MEPADGRPSHEENQLDSESLQANRRIECTLLENKRLRIKLPLFINRLSFIS